MGMNAQSECVQGERVMRKRGPGLLRSGLGIFLLGLWGAGGGMATAQETETPGGPEAVVEAAVDFKTRVQARLLDLKALPADEIEQAIRGSEEAMMKINGEARAARMEARKVQEKMRQENPDVQAKYRAIDEMRQEINAFIDALPEVKGLLDQAHQAQDRLLEETWFRTEAMRILAEKDRASGFPERPEPAAEPATAPAAAEAAEAAGE